MNVLQEKILETMLFVDSICREKNIQYFIMGGTALGAVRHKGFIPWDDDLDIFMVPEEYNRFKEILIKKDQQKFVLQEWKTDDKYIEYAKVRMNGTTFIEESFKDRKDIHQGIYIDIMILHKIPKSNIKRRKLYLESKYVTLLGLLERNWRPKTITQKIIVNIVRHIPNKYFISRCYRDIYKYDTLLTEYDYCYWITPAKYNSGIFKHEIFDKSKDIMFEGNMLKAPIGIKEYLFRRYGDYMVLPRMEDRKKAIHAFIVDVNKDYKEYLN